ncbi:MAG: hypothetical protein ACK55I_11110, partial [bacterium]
MTRLICSMRALSDERSMYSRDRYTTSAESATAPRARRRCLRVPASARINSDIFGVNENSRERKFESGTALASSLANTEARGVIPVETSPAEY